MTKSRGKYTKYVVMKKSQTLASRLPATRKYNTAQLSSMLQRYTHVMVKPSGGWGGKGVLKVSQRTWGIEVQDGKKKLQFHTIDDAASYIRRQGGRSLIIQERIPLARVGGRPYDLRVMIQRRRKSPWTVTGKLAKVAGKGYLITNVRRSGGQVTTFENAVRSSLGGAVVQEVGRRVDRTALAAAKQLHKHYRWIRVIGLDMGLDKNGREWIIEANFKPMLSMFKRLKDKRIYRRIMSYAGSSK